MTPLWQLPAPPAVGFDLKAERRESSGGRLPLSKRLVIGSRPILGTALLLVSLLSLVGGCKSYHVGNQFSYRSDVRTVHVAIVDSDSYRRFSGQRLTEALLRELELRTPLTIAEPGNADSFLRARIIQDTKQILGENRFDDPRTIGYTWNLEVTWVDRAGTPLMPREMLRLNDDVTFIPEGGQSLASAELELIESIARQIVGQMEMPW